jgi:hypothetical protein
LPCVGYALPKRMPPRHELSLTPFLQPTAYIAEVSFVAGLLVSLPWFRGGPQRTPCAVGFALLPRDRVSGSNHAVPSIDPASSWTISASALLSPRGHLPNAFLRRSRCILCPAFYLFSPRWCQLRLLVYKYKTINYLAPMRGLSIPATQSGMDVLSHMFQAQRIASS